MPPLPRGKYGQGREKRTRGGDDGEHDSCSRPQLVQEYHLQREPALRFGVDQVLDRIRHQPMIVGSADAPAVRKRQAGGLSSLGLVAWSR